MEEKKLLNEAELNAEGGANPVLEADSLLPSIIFMSYTGKTVVAGSQKDESPAELYPAAELSFRLGSESDKTDGFPLHGPGTGLAI